MNTPENISELGPNEVFVFGANGGGRHDGGAARFALDHFGAVYGQSDGLQGQSYGIDTMSGWVVMEAAVDRFIGFAFDHPELTFFVTKIGTGIAGWSVADVAPLFSVRPFNVIVPAEFE